MKTWLNKHKRSLMSLLMILLLSFILNFFDSGEEPQTKAPTAESRIELTEGEGTKAQTEPSDTSGTVDESETDITEQPPTESETDEPTEPETELYIDPDGVYTSMEDVALYLYLYGELPDNFMTKSEARKLGWEGGSLEPYAPGMCIGGDRFGNYEGLLPEEEGRSYRECDIDTLYADSRGAKRIVYSNDGLIYYTEDHYESFELIYPEEE